jgi:dTMP kinase
MAGFFISIEGIHGCGKTSLKTNLAQELRHRGFKVTDLIDQGATQLGREIRKIWLENPEFVPVDSLSEALLISASRRQNVVEIIKPNLELGHIVISERFNDALFVFQGYGRGVTTRVLQVIADAVAEGIAPDYTILLDLTPEEAMARLDSSKVHRIENLPIDFHKRLRKGYLETAKQNPDRIHIYDATLEPEAILKAVLADILPYLPDRST